MFVLKTVDDTLFCEKVNTSNKGTNFLSWFIGVVET